ncbi:hypothetical protein AAG906_026487 [Vitis piasezkii]
MKKTCTKYAAWREKKAEVENQLSKKIKVVRSDRGGEYYGRYDGSGEQCPRPFTKYLMECGIVLQYTMSRTPSQNGVVERQNRTLKDMEHEFVMGLEDDPISICQVKQSSDSKKWIEAMKDEMKSMKDNSVWDLVELPKGVKSIGCKWIFRPSRIQKATLDRSRGILGISQKSCIDKMLSRFGMSNCALGDIPLEKGNKFSLHQCPKNELERKDMERFLYALIVGSLVYGSLEKGKWVMRYLQRTKDYMLTYRRSNHLEIVGYSDSDFAGCLDSRRSTSGYIFMLAGGVVSWVLNKHLLLLPLWRQNS